MRRHIQRTRPSTWARKGFKPEEAYRLSEISRAGAEAPYIKEMEKRRRELIESSESKRITKWGVLAEYQSMGVNVFRPRSQRDWDKMFYDYLTIMRDWILPFYPDWKSPGQDKRRKTVKGEAKPAATKRKQLNKKIAEKNQEIVRAIGRGDQEERHRLSRIRDTYQRQLDRL